MRKFEMGTPECGVVLGLLGAVVAFMILFMGFWRTAFVALLFGCGYFVGAVSNKIETLKSVINRLIPPKNE